MGEKISWLRNPKTRNEERQAAGHLLDGMKVRARRQGHMLADSYDDITRSDLYDRSWKTSRRTKWITRQPHREAAGGGISPVSSKRLIQQRTAASTGPGTAVLALR